MFCRVEDKDVVVSVRNAMMKTPIGVQKGSSQKVSSKIIYNSETWQWSESYPTTT
jgi:hypothetical protein